MRWPRFTAIALVGLVGLAFATLAAIKYIRAQYQERENRIEVARQQHIRQFWDYYKQASQARRDGNFALAAELYQKALQLKPDHEDSLYYLGNCRFDLGRYQEALDTYQRLVSVNPQGSSRGYMRIGLGYACFEPKAPFDIAKAEQAFRQALQIDPDSGALLNLGEIALLQGKWEEAWKVLHDFNTDNAMNPAPPYLLGYICWRQGKQKEAWKWFRLAVKRHEVKKPPTPWSEEGDVKASPELRWKAMAKQSLFGEYWLRLRRYLKSSDLTSSMMEQEYQLLHKFIATL